MRIKNVINITLVFPAMFPYSEDEWRELKSQLPGMEILSLLLSRGKCTCTTRVGFESLLGSLFGMPTQGQLPVAALTYWYDTGEKPCNNLLRADPVYLKPDQDCLYLLGSRNLQVTFDEARQLTAEINQLFTDMDWQFEIGSANHWYISSQSKFNINTFPLHEAFGKNIGPYLPQGEDAPQWRGTVNELQMLFHNSNVNLHRETAGHLPINSVWLWGEGEIPPATTGGSRHWQQAWSNEALCGGLAKWVNCQFESLPESINDWIEQATTGNHLVVFDDVRELARADFQMWLQTLIELENKWLIPLLEAMKSDEIHTLTIEATSGYRFDIGKSDLKKWWKKSRPWHDWCG